MNRRPFVLILMLAPAAAALAQSTPAPAGPPVPAETLVRPHSPVLGARNAPVTVVEFFDPACEACRAMYPRVKDMLAANPGKVRVVLRYAAFHEGSDVVIGMLTMAQLQGRLEKVLDALVERQPEWAARGKANIALAWQVARGAGLDASEARQREALPTVGQVLRQDAADVDTLGIDRTPTFFVNGRQMPPIRAEDLRAYVEKQAGKR
jgi:protein-disulfide isomerase